MNDSFPVSQLEIDDFNRNCQVDPNQKGYGIMLCIRDDLTAKLFTIDKSTKSCIVELNLKPKKWQMKYLETPTETLFLPNLIDLFIT